MFKGLSKIADVEYFQVNNKFEIIKHKNGDYFLNGEAVKEYKYISLQSNGFICRKTPDYYFIENISSGKTIKLNASKNYSIGNVFSENGTFYTMNNNFDEKVIEFRKDIFYHNFKSDEEKLLIKQGIGHFAINYDNHVKSIFRSYNKLSSLSLQTGEYEWEVDLGGYGEIRKIIGVVGDNLWVSVNDAAYGFHHLIALNIHSGEVDKAFIKDQTFADFGVMLYEDRQTIVSLYGRISLRSWFYEYDAITGQALRAVEVPALKEHKFGVRSFTVYKNHIYFTATDDSQIVANTVGVLDYDTLELLWHQKVDPGNLLLDPPQVTDTHLYVLGAEGTLHIFEKQETA